jgi:hypothetical protein
MPVIDLYRLADFPLESLVGSDTGISDASTSDAEMPRSCDASINETLASFIKRTQCSHVLVLVPSDIVGHIALRSPFCGCLHNCRNSRQLNTVGITLLCDAHTKKLAELAGS